MVYRHEMQPDLTVPGARQVKKLAINDMKSLETVHRRRPLFARSFIREPTLTDRSLKDIFSVRKKPRIAQKDIPLACLALPTRNFQLPYFERWAPCITPFETSDE
jgi:hypothetical protein